METFEFQESFLDIVKDISLSQLLDTPFTQAFVVSMMANAVNNSHNFDLEAEDAVLYCKLRKAVTHIPHEERLVMYRQCAGLINQRKEALASRYQEGSN